MSPKERFARQIARDRAKLHAEARQEGLEEGRVEGRNEGREQGRNEGREQGRNEGREQGKRDLLVNLLRLKFGELPALIVERVAGAGREQVEAWAARVLTAPTLDAVFVSG
jgi:flagellar biosynthesis/type III secretory pathway protein FliH